MNKLSKFTFVYEAAINLVVFGTYEPMEEKDVISVKASSLVEAYGVVAKAIKKRYSSTPYKITPLRFIKSIEFIKEQEVKQ
jgi:hypothetical protein